MSSRRFLGSFCLFLCLLVACTTPASALESFCAVGFTANTVTEAPATATAITPPPTTSAASFVLLDAAEGSILAERDAHTRRPMASTTKIMTALVVLERLSLDETITVPTEAVGIEGSSIYLFCGERITVRTLLYALMLSSANDAATALALRVAGSIERFAALMNEKAAALGLADTHFCNPHGLPHEEHYTTAADLARLTAAAMQNEIFAEIVATKRYTAPQADTGASRLFLNHNRLLRTLDGAVGVKTGFTRSSGRCLVSAARRNGLLLIAVTLNAPSDWKDHTALMEWGFANYTAFSPALSPLTVPVVGGASPTVTLSPATAPRVTLPADHGEITCTVEAPRFLYAGFGKGEIKGRAVYRMNGEVLFEVPLVTNEAVTAPPARKGLFERIKNLFRK